MEQTNLYAAQSIEKRKALKKFNMVLKWQDVTAAEMKVFIGLFLQMRRCTFPSIELELTNKLKRKLLIFT